MTDNSICAHCKNLEHEIKCEQLLIGSYTCYTCQLGIDASGELKQCIDYEEGELTQNPKRIIYRDTENSTCFEIWGAVQQAYQVHPYDDDIKSLYEICHLAMLRANLIKEESNEPIQEEG